MLSLKKANPLQVLSLKTVSSFVVILTGVDPDAPSRGVTRHASFAGEIPSTTTSSNWRHFQHREGHESALAEHLQVLYLVQA